MNHDYSEICPNNVKTDTTCARDVCHTFTAFWVTSFTVIVMYNVNNLCGWIQCESQSGYAAYYVGNRKVFNSFSKDNSHVKTT